MSDQLGEVGNNGSPKRPTLNGRALCEATMTMPMVVDPQQVDGLRLFACRQALRSFAAAIRGFGDRADAELIADGKLAASLVQESEEISERLEIAEQHGPIS